MRKVICPVCAREVPRELIRRGAFPCPWCKEPLRFPRVSRLKAVPIELCGIAVTFFLFRLAGLEGNTLLFAMIIALAPAGFAACAVAGAVQGFFFPKLERDPGEDSAGILHIVPPPGPPKHRK
jgi:hypothetical protein